ncbi:MAG: hypothetical protein EHM42_13275, partial [Planctomycetaceae bacterium]
MSSKDRAKDRRRRRLEKREARRQASVGSRQERRVPIREAKPAALLSHPLGFTISGVGRDASPAPQTVQDWIAQGGAGLLQGEFGKARAAFARVLELEPDNCLALGSLVETAVKAGDPGSAAEAFQRLKRLTTLDPCARIAQIRAAAWLDDAGFIAETTENWQSWHGLTESQQFHAVKLRYSALIRTGQTAEASRFFRDQASRIMKICDVDSSDPEIQESAESVRAAYFELTDFVPGKLNALLTACYSRHGCPTPDVLDAICRWPGLVPMVPSLFQVGNPICHEMASNVCCNESDTACWEAARQYACGQWGPSHLRFRVLRS